MAQLGSNPLLLPAHPQWLASSQGPLGFLICIPVSHRPIKWFWPPTLSEHTRSLGVSSATGWAEGSQWLVRIPWMVQPHLFNCFVLSVLKAVRAMGSRRRCAQAHIWNHSRSRSPTGFSRAAPSLTIRFDHQAQALIQFQPCSEWDLLLITRSSETSNLDN